MKPIRFLVRVSLWNAGEVAGFEDAVADAYIAAGVAEPYVAPPAEVPIVADPTDPRHDPLAFAKGTDRGRNRSLKGGDR